MKRIMAALLVVISLLSLCGLALADSPSYFDYNAIPSLPSVQGPDASGQWTGEVISRQVTLFSGPKSSSNSLRKLPNGTQFDILDVKDSWAYVSVPNTNGGADLGYVMFDYIIEHRTHIVLRSDSGVYALAGPYAVHKRHGTRAH